MPKTVKKMKLGEICANTVGGGRRKVPTERGGYYGRRKMERGILEGIGKKGGFKNKRQARRRREIPGGPAANKVGGGNTSDVETPAKTQTRPQGDP